MDRKTPLGIACTAVLLILGSSQPAHAQLTSLLHDLGSQAEQQVTQKVENSLTQHGQSQNGQAQSANPMLQINGAYDFTPGPVTLFQQDFATTSIGGMPQDLKTNGSGSVVTVPGIPGHWLELQDSSTYKLNPAIELPQRFTVQFDVIPVAAKITDLDYFNFGFAHDNTVGAYIDDAYNNGAITNVQFSFINGTGDIISASSATDYHNDVSMDWVDYANQILHIAIAVNGDRMQAYLDHRKIVDTKAFVHTFSRYFYFSSSFQHTHDAKLLVSNLRIGGFAPAGATSSVGASDR